MDLFKTVSQEMKPCGIVGANLVLQTLLAECSLAFSTEPIIALEEILVDLLEELGSTCGRLDYLLFGKSLEEDWDSSPCCSS